MRSNKIYWLRPFSFVFQLHKKIWSQVIRRNLLVSEPQDYVFTRLKDLTQGKQNPISNQENLEFDFRIW